MSPPKTDLIPTSSDCPSSQDGRKRRVERAGPGRPSRHALRADGREVALLCTQPYRCGLAMVGTVSYSRAVSSHVLAALAFLPTASTVSTDKQDHRTGLSEFSARPPSR